MERRKTIALYLNNLDEEYQRAVFRAVREEAAKLGFALVCVQGENLISSERGVLNEFPSRRFLSPDGALLLTSVIVDCKELERLEELYRRFSDIPTISIGSKLVGLPSIVIRTRNSMEILMNHLIEEHGYRKFLFIGGPIEHRDNTVREHVFRKIIGVQKTRYPELEATITNGDFLENSGGDIVRNHILTHPDARLDAIVAANDNMAIGALKELRLHPGTHWHRCAVTGFDDIPRARLEKPALTTVRQPLAEVGATALHALSNVMAGKGENVIHADSETIIRASCGCAASGSRRAKKGSATLEQSLDDAEYRNILGERYLRETGALGQALALVESREGLCRALGRFLSTLNVAAFHLIAFPGRSETVPDEGTLLYRRQGTAERFFGRNDKPVALSDYFERLLQEERGAIRLNHLASGGFQLGIVVWSAEDFTDSYLCSSAVYIANTLHRLDLLEQEKERMRNLEREVASRTADLVRINTRLAEEANRRIKVEAEVLKISEMERLRFSLDLHDDICQRLAGISMYCKALATVPDDVTEMVDETLTLTRRYAHDSFPVELDELGLDNALGGLCEALEKTRKVECFYKWDAGRPSPLSKSGDINVYRIVQEALQNVVKHAGAKRVDVSVTRNGQTLTVRVADDGRGNPAIATADGGEADGAEADSRAAGNPADSPTATARQLRRKNRLGLTSMRYRSHQLNASFSIESSAETGTAVTVEIPINVPGTGEPLKAEMGGMPRVNRGDGRVTSIQTHVPRAGARK